ncbi:hypothetical protein PGTUg99_000848 [Puccinia graminis f. sp. tritici]|uniref:Uncharacterized protein n=1 Tax=Puccinia graminis f. sp. tritici TaxID=56615 RepID=A0A5B0NMJ1_PUCGR|nr:hypothetical protein PGTUg99_000848 [Puccinia graminis f. sp. tritici]
MDDRSVGVEWLGSLGSIWSAGANFDSNPAARSIEPLQFPTSSKVFDWIFNSSTTGLVGLLCFFFNLPNQAMSLARIDQR